MPFPLFPPTQASRWRKQLIKQAIIINTPTKMAQPPPYQPVASQQVYAPSQPLITDKVGGCDGVTCVICNLFAPRAEPRSSVFQCGLPRCPAARRLSAPCCARARPGTSSVSCGGIPAACLRPTTTTSEWLFPLSSFTLCEWLIFSVITQQYAQYAQQPQGQADVWRSGLCDCFDQCELCT